MSVSPREPEKQEKQEKREENKFSETLDSLKKNEKVETIINYAQTNTQDTIAYVLMVIGILWMFFNSFYGGILVGLILGFYFAKELLHIAKDLNDFIEKQGVPRSLVLGGSFIAFFIMAPGIFIGAAIMVGLNVMLKKAD